MPKSKPQHSAAEYLPEHKSLSNLAAAARECQGCELYQHATQTVFGEGRASARVVMIGEQPGNDEDIKGKPFIGPSGKLLDEALAAAGIERADAYVTNVVKHFKWVQQGSRRLHKSPGAREISACLPWLEAEIDLLKPEILILLGATASQAIFGKDFRVTQMRGNILETRFGPPALATVHPSSILRQATAEDREREMQHFIADLTIAAELLAQSATRQAS